MIESTQKGANKRKVKIARLSLGGRQLSHFEGRFNDFDISCASMKGRDHVESKVKYQKKIKVLAT